MMTRTLHDIPNYHLPHDVVGTLLDVYRFIGRNDEFFTSLDVDLETFVAQTIREDVYFLAGLFQLSIKEDRLKALIVKDLKPRSKDETILTQIKKALVRIHETIESFELVANEMVSLLQFIYGDSVNADDLAFGRMQKADDQVKSLLSAKTMSKRTALEDLVAQYTAHAEHTSLEKGLLASSFYLDFLDLKPFNTHNEEVGLLMLYILLLNSEYRCFQLVSFFGILTRLEETFKTTKEKASKNMAEGAANPVTLHRFILAVTSEGYKALESIVKNYQFDHQFNKGDYIENTIKKLPEVFTKEAVRLYHPTVSESTINRALKRLKTEKKIAPLGKGRSAKWMKLHTKNEKLNLHEQMRLKF